MTDERASQTGDLLTVEPATFCVTSADSSFGKMRRRGESFSTVTPRPLFSLADTSARPFKAEIDERDVDRVSLGQKVVIQADALDGKRLNGSVVRISSMMGRKSISTGNPSVKSDRDILEAVIGLNDDTTSLPIGLRVTVQFLISSSSKNRTNFDTRPRFAIGKTLVPAKRNECPPAAT
jgi:hypothetical protein